MRAPVCGIRIVGQGIPASFDRTGKRRLQRHCLRAPIRDIWIEAQLREIRNGTLLTLSEVYIGTRSTTSLMRRVMLRTTFDREIPGDLVAHEMRHFLEISIRYKIGEDQMDPKANKEIEMAQEKFGVFLRRMMILK
jgi:hypothetical protein